jgi:hypothetical protein
MAIGRAALKAMIAIALVNFVVLLSAGCYYGGAPQSPLFGSAPTQGPYFLDTRGHLTEVDRRVYIWLLWQSRSLVLTHPLGGLSYWLLMRRKKHSDSASPAL